MDEKTVRQLTLVKYYLSMAMAQYQIDQEPSKFAAINLLHEAFEATLVTCADHMNATVTDRTTIDQYLNKIDDKLGERKLPLRSRVLEFNRARASAKHALILPDNKALRAFFEFIPEFVREACRTVFDTELDSVSLVALIANEEIKQFVELAILHQADGNFYEGLASVRRAFYVMFEKRYDISVFLNADDRKPYGIFDSRSMCEAPFYAKSNRYVQDSVRNPHDFIVLDHAKLDAESLKLGIDTHVFWNIWRLTPSVWCRPTGEWLVKHDLNILQSPSIEKDLGYVIENIVSIALQIQSRRSLERYKHSAYFKSIACKPEAPLFTKASENSPIAANVPKGVNQINVIDAVQGLDTNEWFWTASHMGIGGPYLAGYLRVSDTEGNLLKGINPFEFGKIIAPDGPQDATPNEPES